MGRAVPHGLVTPRADRSFIIIDDHFFACTEGSVWLDYYLDERSGYFLVVDLDGCKRAALNSEGEAKRWCQAASIFAAAPMKNADIVKLHDHMTALRWRLGSYRNGAFIWSHRDDVIDAEQVTLVEEMA